MIVEVRIINSKLFLLKLGDTSISNGKLKISRQSSVSPVRLNSKRGVFCDPLLDKIYENLKKNKQEVLNN